MYQISFKASVKDDLKKIDRQNLARIIQAVEALSVEPYPKNALKLRGHEGLYRLRIGNYRVIYEPRLEEGVIIIHYIRHRKDAYRF